VKQLLETREEWMVDAACRYVDPDLFFPAVGVHAGHAKQVCMSCPVRTQCLEYAMTLGPDLHGIWGGSCAKTRTKLRKERDAAIPKIDQSAA
jgi:WhiB family redox-sensing transcriptional regulator